MPQWLSSSCKSLQPPPQQVFPEPQALVQLPQKPSSVWVSTQLEPQRVGVGAPQVISQLPLGQAGVPVPEVGPGQFVQLLPHAVASVSDLH